MAKTNKTFRLKKNFHVLCVKSGTSPGEVLQKLNLPCNYLTVLGLLRIANYFNVSLDSLLMAKKPT